MKLKQRDWTEQERRLGGAVSRLVQQDRLIRAASLAIVAFGVAVLAAVAGYLVCVSATPQDTTARANIIRFWRS
jgi:hypothetical protein